MAYAPEEDDDDFAEPMDEELDQEKDVLLDDELGMPAYDLWDDEDDIQEENGLYPWED